MSRWIADPEQARRVDLARRTLRVALWTGALFWADMAVELKLIVDIPLGLALGVGAVGVVYTVALERKIWRRNQPALASFIDPVTHELRGGRLPLARRTRYFPLSAVVTTAAVIYLAAT